jgi:hypothetical protein
MKKLFFISILFVNVLYLFADGRQERDRQAYPQVQLKVVNLTNKPINFYYNRLYFPNTINSREEFVTMNTPINRDYPGFIGIEYNNDKNIIIYKVEPRYLEPGIPRYNMQCIVLISETEINIIDGDIDETVDYSNENYFDERVSQYKNGIVWQKVETGKEYIDIKIENRSGISKKAALYAVYKESYGIAGIHDGESIIYTMDAATFSFIEVYINIYNYNWSLLSDNSDQFIYLKNHRGKNIHIIIRENGYELNYY